MPRVWETFSSVPPRVSRRTPFVTLSNAPSEFATASSVARPFRALSERPEKTQETINAVSAAISAKASGSQNRIPIRMGCARRWRKCARNVLEATEVSMAPVPESLQNAGKTLSGS